MIPIIIIPTATVEATIVPTVVDEPADEADAAVLVSPWAVGELVGFRTTKFIDVEFACVAAVDVSVAYFTRDTEFRMLTNLPLLTAADRFTRS